jgi:hypothetical protein
MRSGRAWAWAASAVPARSAAASERRSMVISLFSQAELAWLEFT